MSVTIMGRPHRCAGRRRTHRTYASLAACLWPDAVEVGGEGWWALKAYCGAGGRGELRVTLWRNIDDVEQAKRERDTDGCGRARCAPARHQIVRLPHLVWHHTH